MVYGQNLDPPKNDRFYLKVWNLATGKSITRWEGKGKILIEKTMINNFTGDEKPEIIVIIINSEKGRKEDLCIKMYDLLSGKLLRTIPKPNDARSYDFGGIASISKSVHRCLAFL